MIKRIQGKILSVLCVLVIALLLYGCKGNLNFHNNELGIIAETKFNIDNTVVKLLERKVLGVELDVSEYNKALLVVRVYDKMQIGDRVLEVPWEMKFSFYENSGFRIKK